MQTLTLQRTETSDEGTFGYLFVSGTKLFTIECPWRDNKPDLSCIPDGRYRCQWAKRENGLFCYHVQEVPARSGILIHAANLAGDVTKGLKSDVKGCIGLGMRLGVIGKQRGILNSSAALQFFERQVGYFGFILTIVGPPT